MRFYEAVLDFCRTKKSIFSEEYEKVIEYRDIGYAGKLYYKTLTTLSGAVIDSNEFLPLEFPNIGEQIRIENALAEDRFKPDPFLSIERQVQDAVDILKPVIPLQFITVKLAFKIPGKDYGGVLQLLRDSVQREQWLEDGSWACVIEVPGGMRNEIISRVANRSSGLEVKELD